MATIPLPALQVQQQPSVLQQAGQVMQLKNLAAQQQLIPGQVQGQQQQLQSGALGIQQQKQQLLDQQASTAALKA
jgi:hypothetical protein